MGDGSPRFGIDERFKSPRARSKSGLRNDVSSEAREDDPQDLFDYYTSDDTGGNDEDHFLEDTPVATVLASPGNSGHGGTTKSPIPPSPMARSKKRSHYQHAGGIYSNPAELVNAENRSHSKPPGNDSLHTPRDRTPSRVTFSPVAPDTVREGTRSSSQSSGRSQFSDLPMGREPVLGPSSRSGSRRQHGEMSKPGENVRTLTSPARPKLRHSQRDSEHTTSDSAYTQPSAPEPVSIQSRKDRTFHRVTSENGRAGNHNSQLPVPKARKTNSALFRALEQPYDSSPYSSNPSTDVSLNSLQSDSYDVENDQTDDSIGQLHTVPSNLSSLNGDKVGDIRWSGTHELSRATDVLFHNISHSDSGIGGPQVVIEEPSDAYLSDANDVFTEPAYSDGAEYKYNRPGLPQRLVEHPGSPSLEEGGRRMSMQDKRKAIHESWRASLEGSQFGQPEGTFDPMELERQRAIWEFHESEEAYVDKLQLALRLFVQPLRTQNQRQWISGLASDVMRLFDWLDDIANLHHQLLSALDTLRMKNQSFLIGFSDSIRPFIPLMELYQPYVVRVEEVGKHIMAMALDPDSDFGEFIRMQSALPDCDQESLEDMLAKPAKRLQDYVDMFQRILTLTPRAHPDYLATFSLLHAMHAMTCVIQEVKSQEEEYRVVKSLLNRVRGLPHGFMIAARGRRLLAQGVLQQVHLPGNIEVCHPGPPNMIGRARSGSQSTTISSTTDSTGSLGRSTSSSTARLQDSSTEYSLRSDSSATSYMNTSRDSRKPNRVSFLPHVGAIPPPQTSRSWSRTTSELGRPPDLETVDVYILVFADFVFLAKPVEQTPHSSKSPRRTGPQAWSVLDAVGTFRVLDVTDTSQHDLFPVDGESKGVQILPMVFRIPNSSRGDHKTDLEVSRARREWLDSFNECYLHTLRSVSFASDSEDTSTLSDPYNTLRYSSNSSVVDTLSGGFDFPKSPSQQLDHGTHLKQHGLPLVENAEGEREEREFWAERFKSVFRQLRRTYKGLPLPPLSPRTGGIYEQNLPLHNMTKTCRSSGTMI
ncbi:hypothetical protein FRC09_004252 [Ceratobasidium sp. 395]|nr:hypothetical protein FRC09_004252 [Ceratobasidium sp. 395]